MKLLKTAAPAALMLATLAACSTGKDVKPVVQAQKAEPKVEKTAAPEQQARFRVVQVDSLDGRGEVHYQCGEKGQEPLSAMYGFKDGQVVVAQVKYKGELTDGLWRVLDYPDRNMFSDGKVVWSADLADAANVGKVDGNMLTIAGLVEVNGKQEVTDQVVTRYCKLKPEAAMKPAKGKAKAKKK